MRAFKQKLFERKKLRAELRELCEDTYSGDTSLVNSIYFKEITGDSKDLFPEINPYQEDTVLHHLWRIADPEIRESAIEQYDGYKADCDSVGEAIRLFKIWHETREGYYYWMQIHYKAINNELQLR